MNVTAVGVSTMRSGISQYGLSLTAHEKTKRSRSLLLAVVYHCAFRKKQEYFNESEEPA
jgi:hypothetical protein